MICRSQALAMNILFCCSFAGLSGIGLRLRAGLGAACILLEVEGPGISSQSWTNLMCICKLSEPTLPGRCTQEAGLFHPRLILG